MSATGIVKIGGEHHLWESNLIAAFEKALGIKVQKAQAAMIATLSNQLIVDKRGMITRTPANTKALMTVGPSFQKLLSAQGYGPLITAFVGQFPAGFEFFESTLKALNLPKIDWAAKDKAALQAQQLTSVEALKSVVATVAENARKQALVSIGGLKLQELAELLHTQTGKTLPQAVGLAETAMSMHYATLADIGYAKYEAAGIPVKFKYYGPQDSIARPFCSKLLGSAKAYTRDEIAAMDNGQIPNVMVSRGGYRCRHQWILSLDGMLDEAPQDNAPRVAASDAKSETVTKRVEQALLDAPQNVRKLAARVQEAKVVEGIKGKTSGYDVKGSEMRISPEANAAEILHEYFHHVDYSLAREPYLTVSTDGRTTIGEAIERAIQSFGKLGEDGRKALAKRIAGDLNLEDLMEAISLGEIGRGHGREYYVFNTGSRYREVFANLGALYSTGARWGRLKSVAPELAAAFEKWLDETASKR
jgi:Ni,Fe-hydrogenase III component G